MGHSSANVCSKRSSTGSGTSGRLSSPRANRCNSKPPGPKRPDSSSAGNAASSPKVLRPHRWTIGSNIDTGTTSELGEAGRSFPFELRIRRALAPPVAPDPLAWAFASFFSVNSGSAASTSASDPGGMTVSPLRPCVANNAAILVAATATRTIRPRSAAVRRSIAPISEGLPHNRPIPCTSSITSCSPCNSTRGEYSRAS